MLRWATFNPCDRAKPAIGPGLEETSFDRLISIRAKKDFCARQQVVSRSVEFVGVKDLDCLRIEATSNSFGRDSSNPA